MKINWDKAISTSMETIKQMHIVGTLCPRVTVDQRIAQFEQVIIRVVGIIFCVGTKSVPNLASISVIHPHLPATFSNQTPNSASNEVPQLLTKA
jgi:hypothetical protein